MSLNMVLWRVYGIIYVGSVVVVAGSMLAYLSHEYLSFCHREHRNNMLRVISLFLKHLHLTLCYIGEFGCRRGVCELSHGSSVASRSRAVWLAAFRISFKFFFATTYQRE